MDLSLAPAALPIVVAGRDYGDAMEETFALRVADARGAGMQKTAGLWLRETAGLLCLAASLWRAESRAAVAGGERKAERMDTIGQEIKHAARRLARSPAFTLATALTLALAIGANASIFTVVHRVLFNPLPYGQPDRLITLDYGVPSANVPAGMTSMSWQLYYHLRDESKTLAGIAAYDTADATVTDNGNPERIQVST